MNIGQAAEASGVSAKMIRYYESTGLIRPPGRTPSGYRVYGDRDVHTLKFIRRARDLGFSVEQIESLLELWNNRERSSAEVRALARAQIGKLSDKVVELQAMIHTLEDLVSKCGDGDRPDCPILGDLAEGRHGDWRQTAQSRFGIARLD